MKKRITLFYLMSLLVLVSACSGSSFKAEHNYAIEPFEFTDQQDEKVSLDDLKGSVWLSQFVFTKCTSACPPMMVNMIEVQNKLIEKGVEDYKIVSFSIDPEVDTPEVLQTYLDMYSIPDASKWVMLTGYDQKEIIDLAAKSFKTMVIDDPTSDQVTHGTSFSLVNQEGKVVKIYKGYSDVPYDEIASDMKALINDK
jgi:protein SCO1/2